MKYYYLVSGGKDSTAMVLKGYDEGIKGELVFGNTRMNRPNARETIDKLAQYVGWPLHEVRYEGEKRPIDVVKESFKAIPEAIQWQKERGTYGRNMFKCCETLKHRPMREFQRAHKENSCFALGLTWSDWAIHRHYRLRQLRDQDTFFRRIVKTGLLYYYPLRDWTQQMVEDKLREHGFQDTKGTGCILCPIFCLFEGMRKKDPDTWRRSVQLADKLGIDHPAAGQQFLPCTGVGVDE